MKILLSDSNQINSRTERVKHSWYTQPPKRRLVESMTFRSSHRRCSVRKDFLRNLAKFTRKHPCQSLFFNEVVGLSLQLYWKRDSGTYVFLQILPNRTPFLQATSGRLFLHVVSTRSNTALSQQKTSQWLNVPYRVLSKDALTNNHVRCVSSNQIIHELNKII